MKRDFRMIASINRQIEYAKEIKDFKAYEAAVLKIRKMEIADGVAIGSYRTRGI